MDLQTLINSGDQYFLPQLSVDAVIFGYHEGKLKVLLLRLGQRWILPGGFIGKEEDVNGAAQRLLQERTTLVEPKLNFLMVSGQGDRNFHEEWHQLAPVLGVDVNKDSWVMQRFVTIVYYSTVDIDKVDVDAIDFDDEVRWCDIGDLPPMWMDHDKIVGQARDRLKLDLKRGQIAHDLLPETFTMPQLHALHECILEEELDRSRFQKKMLSTERFERLPKKPVQGRGRNPFLYRVIDRE